MWEDVWFPSWLNGVNQIETRHYLVNYFSPGFSSVMYFHDAHGGSDPNVTERSKSTLRFSNKYLQNARTLLFSSTVGAMLMLKRPILTTRHRDSDSDFGSYETFQYVIHPLFNYSQDARQVVYSFALVHGILDLLVKDTGNSRGDGLASETGRGTREDGADGENRASGSGSSKRTREGYGEERRVKACPEFQQGSSGSSSQQ